MFFIASHDPFAPDAGRIPNIFGDEFMRPDHEKFALFMGDHGSGNGHSLLLVAPSLDMLPATRLLANWKQVSALPTAKWSQLVGSGDPWTRFGVPSPRIR